MIDLKRNTKKELVPATGIRTRASSIYKPNQSDDFKISRGKFSDFKTWGSESEKASMINSDSF